MKLFRRHRCPRQVELTVQINGETVAGPICTENLAHLIRFASWDSNRLDLVSYNDGWASMRGEIRSVEVIAKLI